MSINILSNAKVNLGLKINQKRSDGYHNISTLMQEINLHDEIIVSKNSSNKINLNLRGITTPNNHSNLCYISAQHFLDKYSINTGVDIKLTKNIPIGSGLGGGSSNAACIIKALSKLFQININTKSMEQIASKIGADVPFFIKGGLQLAEGIGDKLTVIPPLCKGYYFLLVFPQINISTQWAYSAYKKYLEITPNKTNFQPLSDIINWSLLENDFEKVVLSTYPEIKKIKDNFEKNKPLFSSLSGSGSTMFGVYDSLESVNHASDLFKQHQTYKALPVH